MATYSPRRSSLFSALLLISFGVFLLLHSYRGFELEQLFTRWWPLIFILWGLSKLYERGFGRQDSAPRAGVTANEILLIVGMLFLTGAVILVNYVGKKHLGDDVVIGNRYTFDLAPSTRPVPSANRITLHNGRGDIQVRPSADEQVHISGKVNVRAWGHNEARRISSRVSVELVRQGDAYELRPAGLNSDERRVALDLEVRVPAKAAFVVRKETGDLEISDIAGEIIVDSRAGNVTIRNSQSDVSIESRRGDIRVLDCKGTVKVAGKGGDVELSNIAGVATIDGDFYGSVRAEKAAKGVHFLSRRTDMTITQLTGRFEAGSGNLTISDSTGNLTLRTSSYDISLENLSGKIRVENANGEVHVRLAHPPKEDIDIANARAGIELTLPGASAFDVTADCKNGGIDTEFNGLKKTSTESGDSHLEGKLGSRGPKILLKTSYRSISLHKSM